MILRISEFAMLFPLICSADVDTWEVRQRIVASIKPFSSSLLEIIVEKPDWYAARLRQTIESHQFTSFV